MKMDKIRLIGASTVDLPIIGADASGPFVFKGADGLDAPEIAPRLSRTTLEKAQRQGKSVALRQVTVTVGLQPDWDLGQTAGELRDILYGLLTPKFNRMVRLEVMYQGVVKAFAQGDISAMPAGIFTKDPTVQITMLCDYPYLLSPSYFTQEPVQSTISGIRAFTVLNEGTAPSGFLMGVILRANVGTSLVLSDNDPNGQRFRIDGINWQAGDRFAIDTRAGSRGVYRGAGGAALVPVLNNINASVSEWMQLYGGDNLLTLNTTAFDWDPTAKFSHQAAFWGV